MLEIEVGMSIISIFVFTDVSEKVEDYYSNDSTIIYFRFWYDAGFGCPKTSSCIGWNIQQKTEIFIL